MTGNIFGCISKQLHLGVNTADPVVLVLLIPALEPHHQATARLPGLLVLDVLQLVDLKRRVVVSDDISHSDLIHAETQSLLIKRLALSFQLR